MIYLKAFIAGIVVPSIILPILLFIAFYSGHPQILTIPFLHLIPILWGVWNILYFAIFKQFLPGNITVRYLITGAVLGLIVALIGVFWLDIPTILGFPERYQYWPLILGPILYAILWWLFVKPLNAILGLKEGGFFS